MWRRIDILIESFILVLFPGLVFVVPGNASSGLHFITVDVVRVFHKTWPEVGLDLIKHLVDYTNTYAAVLVSSRYIFKRRTQQIYI